MRDEVHIWTIPLDTLVDESLLARSVLSPDELERADRYIHERDRMRYAACRAALRRILGTLLDADPTAIAFSYSRFGKPGLREPSGEPLHFNVAHSHNVAMIAVRWNGPVGIDVERMRPDFATDEIARRFFAPCEYAALASLAPKARTTAFFRCWTHKEAFIKARGEGFSFPLDAFDVNIGVDEPPLLLRLRGDPSAPRRWALRDLPAPDGYLAAIAAHGHVGRIVPQTL
jgi:4'-phosphopantetheinyl transferase